jgi:ketosteroid isomerase-like protein
VIFECAAQGMSEAEENKRVVRAAFEAMSIHFAALTRGDASQILCYFRDDAIWINNGTYPDPTRVEGVDAIRNMICGMGDVVEPAFTWNVKRLLADGEHIVLEADGSCMTKTGRRYENKYCFLVRLAGGKIAEITEYMNNASVAAAFS